MASDMDDFAGRLRVLELYSGIGGMHWALKESGIEYDVIQAMDVNTSANKIYQHNFPDVAISASSITKLTLSQLAKWSPNTILMSPPCQPFTRVGKKQDCLDPRTESFLHLLSLLRQLDDKPEYILVENVKGFEVSETRKLLLDMLNDCCYAFQEFLLTPLQFGVPNCRMRYYLIAKLRPLEFAFGTSEKILETIPIEARPWLLYTALHQMPDSTSCSKHSSSPTNYHSCSTQPSESSSSVAVDSSHNLPSTSSVTAESDQILLSGSPSPVSALSNQCHMCTLRGNTSQQSNANNSCESMCQCGEKAKLRNVDMPEVQHSLTSCESQPASMLNTEAGHISAENPIGKGKALNTLTIAEAGRNMRHCEEEDALVCEDGTQLGEYMEKADEKFLQQFLLSDKELRMFVVMDVVHPSFKKSSCFTKRYGHYVEGAGSLVMMTDDAKVVKEASEFKSWAVEHKNRQQWGEAELDVLRQLKLRYFTPREEANLLCFPPQFEFPEDLNTMQCYRVLGNSLNVHVVSILIRLMLMEPGVI